jgi:hypothetical protein
MFQAAEKYKTLINTGFTRLKEDFAKDLLLMFGVLGIK